MAAENILHMNAGKGEFSYANNSILQKTVILKAQPILEDTLKDMYNNEEFPECLNVADLGCSSGPNTLLPTTIIIDTIYGLCLEKNCKAPEFQVSLNDLPGNDFNAVFKSLQNFYEKFEGCFVSGVAGSFYGRLFPSKSLHFVHSSYSLHWLSQVPEKLENNKRNICMTNTSPPDVFEAYLNQFRRDLSTFLRLRSQEIMPRGRMVLTLRGRDSPDPISEDSRYWELLAKSLEDMMRQGLVRETDINSFNFPLYTPYENEVKDIIQNEGSFTIDRLHVFEDDTENYSGDKAANTTRAITEPMLASHFGNSIIDNLFERYTEYLDEFLAIVKTKNFDIVISLTRKLS